MIETELFNVAVNQWRDRKGKGTMICPKPLDCSIPLVTVLTNVLTRSPTANILVLVDGFTDRLEVINKFKELMIKEKHFFFLSLMINIFLFIVKIIMMVMKEEQMLF